MKKATPSLDMAPIQRIYSRQRSQQDMQTSERVFHNKYLVSIGVPFENLTRPRRNVSGSKDSS